MKKEFYIGYTKGIPASNRPYVVGFIIAGMLYLLIFAFQFIGSERGFSEGVYEYGTQTELKGYLAIRPFPALITSDTVGREVLQRAVLLTGPAKKAVRPILKEWADSGRLIEGGFVRLRGTLVYNKGKTLLELTDRAEALTYIGENSIRTHLPERTDFQNFTGRIEDPKCFFGAMKPGYGKIHRSCAALCIAGGLPPLLYTDENDILLVDWSAWGTETFPPHLLRHVGEPVAMEGWTGSWYNWKVIGLQKRTPLEPLSRLEMEGMTLCSTQYTVHSTQ